MRNFVAGNFWLFVALVLLIGKQHMRSAPTRYAFFGLGHWFTPFGYHLLLAVAVILALGFFVSEGRRSRP